MGFELHHAVWRRLHTLRHGRSPITFCSGLFATKSASASGSSTETASLNPKGATVLDAFSATAPGTSHGPSATPVVRSLTRSTSVPVSSLPWLVLLTAL